MEGQPRHLGTAEASPLSFFKRLLAAVFPHSCAVCGEEGTLLCANCRPTEHASLRGVFLCPGCRRESPGGGRCGRRACAEKPLDSLVAAAPYGRGPWAALLHLYKYRLVTEAGRIVQASFGSFVAGRATLWRLPAESVAVVPLPLSPWRQAVRGFNQAEALAVPFVAVTGYLLRRDLLQRRFRWRAQAGLAGEGDRFRNASGSFCCAATEMPEAVWLVDDVATSGATLQEAARCLKEAGVREVRAVTLLRAGKANGRNS